MTGYTPIYNLPYVEASDLVANYPTVSEELAENVEDAIAGSGGLSFITKVDFTNSSAVNVNNCFSSANDSYRIILTGTISSNNFVSLRLRASGTDASGANYAFQYFNANNTTLSGALTTGQTSAQIGYWKSAVSAIYIDISAPGLASPTSYAAWSLFDPTSTGTISLTGYHSLSTAYDGFTLIPVGNMSGTVRVYGYRNS